MTTVFDPGQAPSNQVNILDNGGFEIWQRGTTFNNIQSVGPYSADRWKWQQSTSGMVANITQESTTIHSGLYSMKAVITSSGSSSGFLMVQYLENYKAYAGRTISFSIWVNTTLSGINPQINDGNVAYVGTAHPGDGQWHQLTVTGALSVNPAQLAIYIQQNTVATGTMYFDDAMAVVGYAPPSFIPLNPMIDLARCQRFYEIGTFDTMAAISYNVTQFVIGQQAFKATKRVAPTLTTILTTLIPQGTPTTGSSSNGHEEGSWTSASEGGLLDSIAMRFTRGTTQTTWNTAYFSYTWTASADI